MPALLVQSFHDVNADNFAEYGYQPSSDWAAAFHQVSAVDYTIQISEYAMHMGIHLAFFILVDNSLQAHELQGPAITLGGANAVPVTESLLAAMPSTVA